MRLPVVRGIIDRRILVNFRIDPDVMARNLPAPFRPQLVNGCAIGGICLIRLKDVRPRFSPFPWGISSENAAHRIAVEWDDKSGVHQGVYIPRRDTDSRLNTWAGGRIFPGVHHHASFMIDEDTPHYSVVMQSDDGEARVKVEGVISDHLPAHSVFSSVRNVSDFFERGSLGYSKTHLQDHYDGLELQCRNWHVEALEIKQVTSSYFENESRFPDGSVEFDCALLMRGIDHEWHERENLKTSQPYGTTSCVKKTSTPSH